MYVCIYLSIYLTHPLLPAVCGEVELLEMLLEAGADASTPDLHGAYPLHYAAQVSVCGRGRDLPVLGLTCLLPCPIYRCLICLCNVYLFSIFFFFFFFF